MEGPTDIDIVFLVFFVNNGTGNSVISHYKLAHTNKIYYISLVWASLK